MTNTPIKNSFSDLSDEEFSALDFNLFQRAIADIASKSPNEKNLGMARILTRMNEFKVQDLLTKK